MVKRLFLLLLLLVLPAAADWDVEKPGGPLSTIEFDLDEGTWLNLDVSPDGKTIVFDLLGDIYAMPFGGGEARALTSGLAWDMQPRFSPDGRQIAYTSDRGGGDNIWVMNLDGSGARQVTEENFRLLNSPAWDPSGKFIAARKHFTGERSLGAGEIWLYHVSGGEGLRMTSRPNDQKDVGEPAFSPDGKYVYYSQDMTEGQTFEYNKDSTGEIYVIRRLERATGLNERFITGPGGSVRPTPSPDGKWIAFVRRVREKTVLFVKDLESGRETPLYDGLERDMQETWAIHGVYPSMAWTPDSRQLVFYAGGGFHRLALTGGAVTDIPFHLTTTRQVQQALRFPVEVAPDQFQVKAIRWPTVSPDGKRVVFQALGYLWLQELPSGKPRRLTKQSEHFEFYPSFSRDGKSLVYTTWSDSATGSVRVSDLEGNSRVLVEHGQFITPVFSPDGRVVVYDKLNADNLLSRLYAMESGLFKIPAAGGKPEKLVTQAAHPHFGADPRRVYFVRGGQRVALRSILLDGSQEREHFDGGTLVTDLRLSPDGKYLAFCQDFRWFQVPYVDSGLVAEISETTKALPVDALTEHSADYVHWTNGGSRIHWALGPKLSSRATAGGATEEVSLSFPWPTDKPEGQVAVVGGKVITMEGDTIYDPGTVVVSGNRIQAVGPADQVQIPAGSYQVDARGKVVMPGFVDVHWHGSQGSSQLTPQENWYDLATLAFGVTTIHDPSNDTAEVFSTSELGKAGRITAPRVFSTGTIVYGAKAPSYFAAIDSLEDARAHLGRLKAWGAFSVKSYNQPRREQRQQVLAAARELGLMVVPEGGSLFEHNMTMVVDGHTGVEHSIPVPKVYQDVLTLWSGTQVGYTPTLVVAYGGIWGENYWYDKTNVWENTRLARFVPQRILDPRSRRRTKAPDEDYNHFRAARVAADLEHAGVKVNLGAHGQREGLGAHWEMWMFVQGGMSPMEALRAATLNGAHYLGLDGDIGSLKAGKLADLIVLDRDPLADIYNTESVRYVMANGRLYEADSMNQIGNHPGARGKLWWER